MLKTNELQKKSPDELLEIITQLQQKVSTQQAMIQQLHEALLLNRRQRFGKSSERDVDEPLQLSLFNEAEMIAEEPIDAVNHDEEKVETITASPHQRKKTRTKLPSTLPRVEIVHDLTEPQKQCPCGCQMTCIGDERSEQLDVIPAKVQVLVHIRKKYACSDCKQNIQQAVMPKQPIAKSLASPNTLAYVLVAKFQDALPLYRQEAIFNRFGIEISRSTLSNWVIKSAELLKPLVNLLQSNLLEYDVAYADETPVQVLHEPGRTAEQQSYMWLFAGGEPDKMGVIYRYSPTRKQEVPIEFLRDFKGYLHCDGYAAYESLTKQFDITLVGCWFHARRKFMDAKKT